MSTHPNVILMSVLTPDGLSRKTMREILSETDTGPDSHIMVGDYSYNHIVMESDYDEGYQIAADEGALVFFDMVTYGYGEIIKWDALEEQKRLLEEWSIGVCSRHHCKSVIFITANYW